MKLKLTKLNLLAVALVVLAASCASNNTLLDRENAAVGAGFKTITPANPAQLARLQQLPVDRVTRITVDGKPYYVLPDLKNSRAYVGGPKQYQAYQQFRREQVENAEDTPAPSPHIRVVEVNDMGWTEWRGWEMGEPGWY
jgi:uncharacterized ParB-like nuclease family protein